MGSVLHDYNEERARLIVRNAANALLQDGELWIHGCLLNDSLTGPEVAADYSAQLCAVVHRGP